ncbi:MAG: MbnP family protein [Aureispira sp.]
MIKTLLFLTLCLSTVRPTSAQDTLQFSALFQGQPLQLDRMYVVEDSSQQITISRLRFYIGVIELWQDQQQVYTFPATYYLVDLEAPNSLNLPFNLPKGITYNHLKLHIGVDSLTNAQGVQGGALDPMQGMYWTWQSGYINFKLEGTSTHCMSRGQEFQFHIGGFKRPYYPLQELSLEVQQGTLIEIGLAIDQLLFLANLKENDHIMSPNQKGVDFSQLFPFVFFIL